MSAILTARSPIGPRSSLHLGVALTLLWVYSTSASVSVGVDPMRIAQVPTGGVALGCAVEGNFCYVAAGASGLLIFDVTEPAHPVQVGSFATRRPAQSVHLLGGAAFVGEQPNGSELLDLTNPTHPVLFSEWAEVGTEDAVFVSGKHIFMAGGASLRIVDIRDLHSPKLLGSYVFPFDGDDAPLNNIRSVAARGGFAYCGDRDVLWVFDVNDPAHIRLVGNTLIPQGDMTDLVPVGSMLYAAARWGGLHGIDVTDPNHPKVVGEVQGIGGWPHSMVLSGDRAVVATEQGWVVMLDMTTPSTPHALGGYLTASASGVQIAGGFCYVAAGALGLDVVDLVPANPTLPAFPSDTAGSIAVQDSLAVLATDGSIRTFELGKSGEVKPLGVLFGGLGGAIQAAIGDGFACYVSIFGDILDGGRFRTVDLRDPAHPQRMGSYEALDEIDDYVLSGRYAYLSVQFHGLHILDLTDPALPSLVGSLQTGTVSGVGADAGRVCIAEGESGVGVVDVLDPARPSLVGRYADGARYQRVLVHGSVCYAADAAGGVQVLDLSQPDHPRSLGHYTSSLAVKKLLLAGPLLYLWGNDQRMEVLDVSDPARIWRVGGNSMAVHRNADLAADQGRIWISGFGESGLTLLPRPFDLLQDIVPGGGAGPFGFRLYARPGEPIPLERSEDLKSWAPWKTVIPGEIPMRLRDDAANGLLRGAFFRVRIAAP